METIVYDANGRSDCYYEVYEKDGKYAVRAWAGDEPVLDGETLFPDENSAAWFAIGYLAGIGRFAYRGDLTE